MNMDNYTYRAIVTRVIDGDTICCDIDLKSRLGFESVLSDQLYDLGFGFWVQAQVALAGELWYKKVRIRLFGLNAPEKNGVEKEQGLRSKDFLKSVVEGQEIFLETVKNKHDSFGRYLGIIYLQGVNINDMLVSQGYAQIKTY